MARVAAGYLRIRFAAASTFLQRSVLHSTVCTYHMLAGTDNCICGPGDLSLPLRAAGAAALFLNAPCKFHYVFTYYVVRSLILRCTMYYVRNTYLERGLPIASGPPGSARGPAADTAGRGKGFKHFVSRFSCCYIHIRALAHIFY